ncbi:MAG: TolC family protein, partial [Nostoc sp. C3-bin3]|nr:TolC family protein [Nostoc sp. C3-bin3]
MNFSLFFVHFTWVSVVSAILFPIASAANPPAPQNSSSTVKVPDNLNPNPNPLQLPTKPEEVKVQGTVPISLAQALELAKRNNQDLQVTILELERSRSALRESQAALLPNANIDSSLTNRGNGFTNRSSQSTTSFNGSAQLNYDLYTSGNR